MVGDAQSKGKLFGCSNGKRTLSSKKKIQDYSIRDFQLYAQKFIRDYFSNKSLPFGDPVLWVDHHLENSACNIGQPCHQIFIKFGSNAHGSLPLVIT